jgi:hypothetical protein
MNTKPSGFNLAIIPVIIGIFTIVSLALMPLLGLFSPLLVIALAGAAYKLRPGLTKAWHAKRLRKLTKRQMIVAVPAGAAKLIGTHA